ncbi:hypothetical protein NQZ68_029480 [Dissostichus eleginoides]|nr:hypothetical protein NQZ68_029480 [Dissostichus eleginoides]
MPSHSALNGPYKEFELLPSGHCCVHVVAGQQGCRLLSPCFLLYSPAVVSGRGAEVLVHRQPVGGISPGCTCERHSGEPQALTLPQTLSTAMAG